MVALWIGSGLLRSIYSRSLGQFEADTDPGCFLCRGLPTTTIARTCWSGGDALGRRPQPVSYNQWSPARRSLVHRGTLGRVDGADLTEPIATVRKMDRHPRSDRCGSAGVQHRPQPGKSAGAGLPGHPSHWHVVPRWDGDTNFTPVLGHAEVIVESLFEFYDRLAAELAAEVEPLNPSIRFATRSWLDDFTEIISGHVWKGNWPCFYI